MNNKYAGKCFKCGRNVKPGAGVFERYTGGWRVQHTKCQAKPIGFKTGKTLSLQVIDSLPSKKPVEQTNPNALF